MGAFEEAIALAVKAGVAEAVKPLEAEVKELRKVIETQSTPHDEWVKQVQLPKLLGSIGLTKIKELCRHPDAPKPNAIGLYSLSAWREYMSKAA